MLTDNYAAAVASQAFASAYDPDEPDRPYLPPGLFDPTGPWVCVGRPDGPVAPEHVRDDLANPYTNSAFLVFIRLPAGRGATLNLLKALRDFNQPLWVAVPNADGRPQTWAPNPQLPQFPAGTEVALVRRALLIDSSHDIVATPITESVQIRVYRDAPMATCDKLSSTSDVVQIADSPARSAQAFFEFQLCRSLLFAGTSGGLRAIGVDERDFKTGFRAHGWDVFERPMIDGKFQKPVHYPIWQNCQGCHSFIGAASFNSFFNYRGNQPANGHSPRPASLSETSISDAIDANVQWRKERQGWRELRELLGN